MSVSRVCVASVLCVCAVACNFFSLQKVFFCRSVSLGMVKRHQSYRPSSRLHSVSQYQKCFPGDLASSSAHHCTGLQLVRPGLMQAVWPNGPAPGPGQPWGPSSGGLALTDSLGRLAWYRGHFLLGHPMGGGHGWGRPMAGLLQIQGVPQHLEQPIPGGQGVQGRGQGGSNYWSDASRTLKVWYVPIGFSSS